MSSEPLGYYYLVAPVGILWGLLLIHNGQPTYSIQILTRMGSKSLEGNFSSPEVPLHVWMQDKFLTLAGNPDTYQLGYIPLDDEDHLEKIFMGNRIVVDKTKQLKELGIL